MRPDASLINSINVTEPARLRYISMLSAIRSMTGRVFAA